MPSNTISVYLQAPSLSPSPIRGLCCMPNISVRFTSCPGHMYDLRALLITHTLYPRLQEVVVCSHGERLAAEPPPRRMLGGHAGVSALYSIPRSSREPPGWFYALMCRKQTPQQVRLYRWEVYSALGSMEGSPTKVVCTSVGQLTSVICSEELRVHEVSQCTYTYA